MAGRKSIDGFMFADPADVSIAEDECKRIKYIAGKMNMDNPASVLAVYDKLISGGIFATPVGYDYLRSIQSYLYKCPEISDESIRDIPVAISYTSALNSRTKERKERIDELKASRSLVKTFRREYLISIAINVILFIAIIAMFIITLKAENPNMINYRTAIVNQYSEWEQELSQKEEELRQKELELKEFTKSP